MSAAYKSRKNVLGQFLANFWIVAPHCGLTRQSRQRKSSVILSSKQSRRARRASTIQVAVNFSSRNQHAPEAGKLPEHLSPNESADCFFANPQLGCTAFYVESLAFGNCRRIHNFTFTRRQHTTHDDSFGVALLHNQGAENQRGDYNVNW
jgi:hypothetical protein